MTEAKGRRLLGTAEREKRRRTNLSLPAALAAWDNECAGWMALGRGDEAKGVYVIDEDDDVVWARPHAGAPRPLPGMILLKRARAAGAEKLLARAVDRFAGERVPLFLSLPPEGDVDAWMVAARANRFRHESLQLLMTCGLKARRPVRQPARYDVREAVTDEDWDAALEVIGEVFGDPDGLTRFYNPRDAVRMFVVYINFAPVAAAALWPFANVAGVYSVATKERFRGLGIAYALVEHMLETATREGFELASLRTTGDLIPVYMRHGFGIAGQMHRYRLDL